MRLLLTVALLLITGCTTQPQSEATNTAASTPEVDVILAFLQSQHASTGQQVIEDTLFVGDMAGQFGGKSYQEYRDSLLTDASDGAPTDLIRDFCEKNRHPQPAWPELNSCARVVLLSRHEEDAFFGSGNHVVRDGWKRFYVKYPRSNGIMGLSRVGFNRQQNIAMFWVRWQGGWLLGSDRMYIMQKHGRKWVESSASVGPIITS